MLKNFFSFLGRQGEKLQSESFLFSVIIPTFRRPYELSRLLYSMCQQTFARDQFQVIIVDDGGGIPLEPVLEPFQQELNLTLCSQNNTGPAEARNKGASLAEGDYLAFTDDDCRPAPVWLEALAEGFKQTPRSLCGGNTRNALIDDPFAQVTQLLADFVFNEYKPAKNLGAYFQTNNIALPRKDFYEMGGFDSDLRFGEDRELCHRWTLRKGDLVYNKEARVLHCHPLNFKSFLRLHFSYGTGTAQFKNKCAQKGLHPAELSPLSYYINLLLFGVRQKKNVYGFLNSLLLLLSQMCYFSGYAWQAVKNKTS